MRTHYCYYYSHLLLLLFFLRLLLLLLLQWLEALPLCAPGLSHTSSEPAPLITSRRSAYPHMKCSLKTLTLPGQTFICVSEQEWKMIP